ncbi:hypothetical protein MRX96_007985 [Rhipicephalus microplus]
MTLMRAWARATSRTWFHEATQPRFVQCPIEVGDHLTKDRLQDPVVKLRKTSPWASSRKTPAPMSFPTSTRRPFVTGGADEERSSCTERPSNTLRGGSSHDYDSVTWYDSMNFWSVNHSPQTSCRGHRRAHSPALHAPRLRDFWCGTEDRRLRRPRCTGV